MKILFVCTGNVFRNVSAEFLLKDYLKKHNIKGIEVASPGTVANPEPLGSAMLSELSHFGIDASKHRQRRLTKELVESSDIIIAMVDYHQRFVRDHFGVEVPLFNEICYGKSESVWDVNDVVLDQGYNRKAEEDHIRKTIKHIHNSIPYLVKNLKR